MEKLRRVMGLEWDYVDAIDKNDTRIDRIFENVKYQRTVSNAFEWPEDLSGLSPTTSPFLDGLNSTDAAPQTSSSSASDSPLLCATEDNTIPDYSNSTSVPYHMLLSRGMMACWYSHLRIIMRVVDATRHILKQTWDGKEGVAMIFEDDVDFEWDLRERLTDIWAELPRDWDMVMLGASMFVAFCQSTSHTSQLGRSLLVK